jgi:hypothetical protein
MTDKPRRLQRIYSVLKFQILYAKNDVYISNSPSSWTGLHIAQPYVLIASAAASAQGPVASANPR